jgi:hypothetical protein
MMPGPNLVYKCPKCGNFTIKGSLLSGNTFGSKLFSDGKRIAPMLPDFPYIIKCKKCKSFYKLEDKVKIGEYRPFEEKNNVKWKDADKAEFLSVDEYNEAIKLKIFNNKEEEQYLRRELWWAFNDNIRKGNEIFRNNDDIDIYESNCKIFIEILDKNEINEKIMCAELYRNLGNFIECINILETINEEKYNWVKEILKKECEKNNKYIIELKQ